MRGWTRLLMTSFTGPSLRRRRRLEEEEAPLLRIVLALVTLLRQRERVRRAPCAVCDARTKAGEKECAPCTWGARSEQPGKEELDEGAGLTRLLASVSVSASESPRSVSVSVSVSASRKLSREPTELLDLPVSARTHTRG